MPKKAVFAVLFVSWVVLITCLSLFDFSIIDFSSIGGGGIKIPYADKIVHAFFYLLFVVLGWQALKEHKQMLKFSSILPILIVSAIAYGALMEVFQYILPFKRAAELSDIFANTCGALLGGLLIKTYFSRIE